MPGRDSRVGLSSRESISCRMSVGTTATCVVASARATRATAAESSPAHPFSSSVHPDKNRSCAAKYGAGFDAAACTTPAMCSSDLTPTRAAVIASVFPRCAAIGSRSVAASSAIAARSCGVIFV